MLALTSVLPLVLATAAPPPVAAPPTNPLVGFGAAITFAGDELLVGRPNSSALFPLPASNPGGVLVFRRGAGGSWAEAGNFAASDVALGDGFGSVIAADGNLAVVGAPAAAEGVGAAYVFERSASGWRQAAKLAAPGAGANDRFGTAIAVGGGVIVIGAPGRDSARGVAYAFRQAGGSWSATRIGGGREAGDNFGASIALVGGTVAIGAPGPSPIGGPFGGGQPPRAGSVQLFGGAGGDWRAMATLVGSADSTLLFGFALASSGSSLFVSAPGTARVGAVVEFRGEGAEWREVSSVKGPVPSGLYGAAVAADGDALLVGAPYLNQAKGATYAYRRQGSGWSAPQELPVDAVGMMIAYGATAAVKGDLAIVAAPGADFFEGVGYVFGRDGAGRWAARGTIVDRPESMPAITGAEHRCTGTEVEGFECKNVDLLSFLPTTAMGAGRGIMVNDLWGWTDEASGREFALVGRMDATAFVEITDPGNPKYLGELPLHAGAHPNIWRDIKTYKNYALVVSDNAGPHGVQVFDLKQLLNVTGGPVTFKETAHYDGIASAHNIVVNEGTGFAYAVSASGGGETCGGALHMIDIRDPLHPKFAGCFADKSTGNGTGATHDSQCVVYHGPDAKYRGKEVCFNSSATAVGIADMSEKPASKPIAVAAYPNTVFAHQGWLSEDHKYFYLNDEGDEIAGKTPKTRTIIWDVESLEEPVLVGEFMGATSATDHNMYVKGNYLFQSNYVAGLRVIDVSDPNNLREVGYLDTVPFGENIPGFAGSWSNYPYFKSGTIIVSSMREGLFLVRHRPERPIP
ncbi:MAG: choice-of-anchor B family protein [Gemmatimonadales bacterium]